eukprot:381688_1
MYTRYQELDQDFQIITKYAYSAKIQRLIKSLTTTKEWKLPRFAGDRTLNENRFIILRNDIDDIRNTIISLHKDWDESKQQTLSFDCDLRSKIITNNSLWQYIFNGNNFCAFQASLMSMSITEPYVSFFQAMQPVTNGGKFAYNLFMLFNNALSTALNNEPTRSKYAKIVDIINTKIRDKGFKPGMYFSIKNAMHILDFNCEEIVTALQRKDIGAGNCVTLNYCSNSECELVCDGVGRNSTNVICKWSQLDIEKHVVPLVSNSKNLIVESNVSCIFSEINMLLGGHPMGKCLNCNNSRFSINFRQITATSTLTFGHSLGLYSNFDVNKFDDIPALGIDGRIYKYQVAVIFFNEPIGQHWRGGLVDYDSKSVIDLNSLGGKVTRYNWEWLEKQQPYIHGVLLVKKDVPPDETIDAVELIASVIKTCKLSMNDIKHFQPRMLTKLMEDRGLWKVFENDVTIRYFLSKVSKKVNNVVIRPGDTIQLQYSEMCHIFAANEYYQTFRTRDSKIRDVLNVWIHNYENKWSESHTYLTDEQANTFKDKMNEYWNSSVGASDEKAKENMMQQIQFIETKPTVLTQNKQITKENSDCLQISDNDVKKVRQLGQKTIEYFKNKHKNYSPQIPEPVYVFITTGETSYVLWPGVMKSNNTVQLLAAKKITAPATNTRSSHITIDILKKKAIIFPVKFLHRDFGEHSDWYYWDYYLNFKQLPDVHKIKTDIWEAWICGDRLLSKRVKDWDRKVRVARLTRIRMEEKEQLLREKELEEQRVQPFKDKWGLDKAYDGRENGIGATLTVGTVISCRDKRPYKQIEKGIHYNDYTITEIGLGWEVEAYPSTAIRINNPYQPFDLDTFVTFDGNEEGCCVKECLLVPGAIDSIDEMDKQLEESREEWEKTLPNNPLNCLMDFGDENK